MTFPTCTGRTRKTHCTHRLPSQIRGLQDSQSSIFWNVLIYAAQLCFPYFRLSNISVLPLLYQVCCSNPVPHFHLSDIPPLSDSRSSLLIFSSKFEHILFRLWICFCKMKTVRNCQDTYNSLQISKRNEQAFPSQDPCNQM